MKGVSLCLVITLILALSLATSARKHQRKLKIRQNAQSSGAKNEFPAKGLSRRKKSASMPTEVGSEIRHVVKNRKPKRKVTKKKHAKVKKVKPGKVESTPKKAVNRSISINAQNDLYEEQSSHMSIASPGWVPHLVKRKCGKCIWQECPSVRVMKRHCPSGLVRDQCNCCPQCANGVGMPCYTSKTYSQLWLPPCGDDLECVPVYGGELDPHSEEAWGSKRDSQGICSCKDRTPICGNNNSTYDNICEFREASARLLIHRNINITILHKGPCSTVPKIDSAPLDALASLGHVVSFRCETSGFPLPRVQWLKRSEKNSRITEDELPGYLSHAVTQMRGGPGKYQLTTWLTLDKIRASDKGSYVCRSSNQYGMVDRAAILTITEP